MRTPARPPPPRPTSATRARPRTLEARRPLPLALLFVSALSCGGPSHEGSADPGEAEPQAPTTGESPPTSSPVEVEAREEATPEAANTRPEPRVTFQRVFEEVIVPAGCTSGYCHGSGAGYLVLTDRTTSYRNLVDAGVFNGGCGLDLRVRPRDPEGSLLWRKVAPDIEVCASKMPQGSPGLPADRAEIVRQWILSGAPE